MSVVDTPNIIDLEIVEQLKAAFQMAGDATPTELVLGTYGNGTGPGLSSLPVDS